jgi:ATP-dependent protease ClpP protease subunit
MPTDKNDLSKQIEQFHDVNLFIPTRTIYFGGNEGSITSDINDVDSNSIQQTIKNLLILESLNHEEIILLLSTDGGSWELGVGCYDLIKTLKSPIKIISLGKCYSMGTVILQAGTTRLITQNTTLLIHDGSFSTSGECKSAEAWAEASKDFRKIMYNIYYSQMVKKNPKLTLKDIENLCVHDTILNSKQTIELGLADGIL